MKAIAPYFGKMYVARYPATKGIANFLYEHFVLRNLSAPYRIILTNLGGVKALRVFVTSRNSGASMIGEQAIHIREVG